MKVVVLIGPTASGKNAVALELAKRINGEIINADSRQIYKFMSAGTAQPGLEEQKIVRHHLYGFLPPNQTYSAGQYVQDVSKILESVTARKTIPILVGGTGLYIRALFDGLSPLPKGDPAIRQELSAFAEKEGRKALHDQLKKADPVSAEKIPYQNIQRMIRALEVYKLTGKPISEWHHQGRESRVVSHGKNFLTHDSRLTTHDYFGLLWSKEQLQERIFQRSRQLCPKILEETKALLQMGYQPSDPGLQSIGYREAIGRIQNRISDKEFFDSLLKNTLHYAKRQMTWFRTDTRIQWLDMKDPFNPQEISENLVTFVNQNYVNKKF